MSEVQQLIYKPPNGDEFKAIKGSIGVRFSNDVFLTEAWLIKMNVKYDQSELEQTPFGMCARIKHKENKMDIIKSKKTLHSLIKETLESCPEDNIKFPRAFTYCEGIGQPIFKLTIEKTEEDFFIDEKGQKWVKA